MELIVYVASVLNEQGDVIRRYDTPNLDHMVSELLYMESLGIKPVIDMVYTTDSKH